MIPLLETERQQELKLMLDDALKDKNLQEALVNFEVGQNEFLRALLTNLPIKITSTNTTNPGQVGKNKCQHG